MGRTSIIARRLYWRPQFEALEHRHLLAANPIIAEFVANNDDSLLDGDGNPSDWIELYNAGDDKLDLNGWYLTDDADDMTKWRFPDVDLDAGRYLVVFASGHVSDDYVDPAGNLHTSFKLSSKGEYLALVRPNLSAASEFSPQYLRQRDDISHGLTMTSVSEILVSPSATARTLVPTTGIGNDWTGQNEPFNDSQWTANATGVGYSVGEAGTPGLVAEWTFETSEGISVADGQLAVGVIDETAGDVNGPHTGTANGMPERQGPSGLAYSSDTPVGIGSSHSLVFPAPENATNHIRVPVASDDDLATMTMGDFRVEAWFKTTDTGRNVLTGSYVGGATSLNLELHTSNRGRIYVQGPTSTTDLNIALPTNSRDGNWHHLAGVRNGGTVELYYDSMLVGSQADTAGDFVVSKPAVFIGRDNRTTSVIFNGSIDNVRFYNSADTSALVAAYDFDTVDGVSVVNDQDAAGQVDDTGSGAGGPYHGAGSSTSGGMGGRSGINYSTDVASLLTDSSVSLEINEGNTNVESFNIGMPPSIANLTQGDFTLQAWFKTTDAGRSILMGSYTGPDNALNLELHTGNRIRVYIQNGGGGTTDLNVPVGAVGNSRDGEWHSVTSVRRGTDVELYFDGVLVGQTSDAAGPYVQTAADFYFGRDSRTGATRFDGNLDNIRFWNIALTPEQIVGMAGGATPGDVTGGAFDALIGTDVETDMRGKNTSALLRVPFQVDDPLGLSLLNLRMKYDDGFIAYINGHEVARRNSPEPIAWNSAATADRPVADGKQYESIEIGAPSQVLRAGTNILAIHGLSADINAGNFLILPELIGVSTTVNTNALRFFPQPTPGGPNGNAVLGFVDDTRFSVDRGFYEAADLQPGGILQNGIEITTATPGARIRYTIDGTWPTATHGTEYTGPIMIDTTTTLRATAVLDGFLSSNTDTHTYIFLDDVIRQPSNPGENDPSDPRYPAPFPRTHQRGVRADYEMDPAVVQNPLYEDTLKEDLKSIPTLSLVMDMDDIFNQPNGIWSNSQSDGRLWERRTSVEFFDPQDPDREFQLNSAIRIQGRASRTPSSSIKHSFRLIFKDSYGPENGEQPTGGPTKLDFPWFEGSDVEQFDTMILRGGYNYSYLHNSNDQNIRAQYIRERFMREAQIASGQLGSHGSYAHLYVNGLYFGLYAPQERPDASFMAQHLGGDKEDYDVISAGQVRDGNADAWNELLTRSGADLSVQENYDAVLELLDVESLIDYMIVHIWGGTTDWPAPGGQFRNWIVGRERKEGAGFKFFVWDAEYSIQGIRDNVVRVDAAGTPAFIYSRLRANPEFRLMFADHVQKHFFNAGALTPEVNIARYAGLANEIDRAIVGESARWGDTRGDGCNPCLRDPQWVNELDWVLNTYLAGRTETVLDQFVGAGLFPTTAAPVLNQHGGAVNKGFMMDLDKPNGAGMVYYTLDGTDPRRRGGDAAPGALVFEESEIAINGPTSIRARVLKDGVWSALTEAQFVVTGLRITEINYHPVDPSDGELAVDNSQFEFIELANTGTRDVDLTGVHLSQAASYDFPDASVLTPGERAVVVNNREAFESRYGTDANVVGEFAGDLSDVGETIELRDDRNVIVAKFTYQASGDWPSRANGQGSSLEVIDTQGSYLDAGNWRASSELGGSPAQAGFGPGEILINEVIGYGDSPNEDMLELFNSSDSPVNVGNWFIGNPNTDPSRYQLPASTTIAPRGYLVLSESELGFGFDIGEGDSISLIRADENGTPGRFVDQVEIDPALAGVSLGPWPDRSGPMVALADTTFGQANSNRRVSGVIISELNFDPLDIDGNGGQRADVFEYLELYNTTDRTIDIGDWRLSGSLEFTFDTGTTIAAGDTALLVTFSSAPTAAVFRFAYGVNSAKPLIGRYRRPLSNDKGEILLERPSGTGDNYIYVDEVVYDSRLPFSVGANGTGNSFTRATSIGLGNAPSTWIVAAASPGSVEFPEQKLIGDSNGDGRFDQLDIIAILTIAKYLTDQPATYEEGDWNEDGFFNVLDIVAALQSNNYVAGANAAFAASSDGNLAKRGSLDDDTANDEVFAVLSW